MATLSALCKRKHVLAGVLWLVGWFSVAPPVDAQRFFLPVEVAQGVLFDGSPNPYMGSLRAHGLFALGQAFRVGPSFALAYANPNASFQAGGRLQVRVKAFKIQGVFDGAQIDLAAEALWGTEDRNPIGGALLLSINRVVQLSIRGGYDLEQEAAYLGTSIGTDLTFLFGGPPPAGRIDIIAEPPLPGCLGLLFTEARIRALASFDPDQPLIGQTEEFLGNSSQVAQFKRSESLKAAQVFLGSAGLEVLAQQIADTIRQESGEPACQGQNLNADETLDAFLLAWSNAAHEVRAE